MLIINNATYTIKSSQLQIQGVNEECVKYLHYFINAYFSLCCEYQKVTIQIITKIT